MTLPETSLNNRTFGQVSSRPGTGAIADPLNVMMVNAVEGEGAEPILPNAEVLPAGGHVHICTSTHRIVLGGGHEL